MLIEAVSPAQDGGRYEATGGERVATTKVQAHERVIPSPYVFDVVAWQRPRGRWSRLHASGPTHEYTCCGKHVPLGAHLDLLPTSDRLHCGHCRKGFGPGRAWCETCGKTVTIEDHNAAHAL